jgi:hypothetical protein
VTAFREMLDGRSANSAAGNDDIEQIIEERRRAAQAAIEAMGRDGNRASRPRRTKRLFEKSIF